MPPLIIDENKGITIDFLKYIEQISDYQFEIKIMNYVRAKKNLKDGFVDMIGHTPLGLETESFYDYAIELEFSIPTKSDFFTRIPLESDADLSSMIIGVPSGNENFLSSLSGIPVENFVTGRIENLLNMLKAERIDAFWFERVSTFTIIDEMGLKGLYYNRFPDYEIPVSLAVRNDEEGLSLSMKFNEIIEMIDYEEMYKNYLNIVQLEDKGIVNNN